MILFSTVLRLNKNFTQDDFIKTVIEWNQNSPHPENVISGIVWNGERSARYGYNLQTISHRYFIVEKFYPMDFRKSSKNPIQKSKFFNLADMFGYKTMPNTDVIANDLNGWTWEEF